MRNPQTNSLRYEVYRGGLNVGGVGWVGVSVGCVVAAGFSGNRRLLLSIISSRLSGFIISTGLIPSKGSRRFVSTGASFGPTFLSIVSWCHSGLSTFIAAIALFFIWLDQ